MIKQDQCKCSYANRTCHLCSSAFCLDTTEYLKLVVIVGYINQFAKITKIIFNPTI